MTDTAPWDQDSWTQEHPGFPYYMFPEDVEEQKDQVEQALDNALDTQSFTPDYPSLALWDNHYLFVYGTLKRNQPNHKVLLNKECQFLAPAFTGDPHWILKQSRGGIPVALGAWNDDTKMAKNIKGEIWLVSTPMIKKLDVFEQNGAIYRRLKIRMAVPQPKGNDLHVPAWMYVGVKSAWSSGAEILSLSPSFEREKAGVKTPFYTFIDKVITNESV